MATTTTGPNRSFKNTTDKHNAHIHDVAFKKATREMAPTLNAANKQNKEPVPKTPRTTNNHEKDPIKFRIGATDRWLITIQPHMPINGMAYR